MNLKDFLASREKPPELYWSLVLETGWVQAGIWYIGEKEAEVISVSPPTAWEVEDELIGATDAALSSAVQKLPEEYQEPNKTVFGVPSAWVKGGEISEEYLARIKKLCTELSLSPVGFVVLPEAIAHLYKSEEGAPVSAIILGLGKDSLEISVFKLGNLVGSTSVSRSVSIVEDVTEGLTRFEGASPLPSRFIIFDGKGGELEEAKEALMQASWEEGEKVKFLHSPKAEILQSDRKVLATSLAGAAEMGDITQVASKDVQNEQQFETEMTPEVENVVPPEKETSPEDLGFAVGEDVTLRTQAPAPMPPPQIVRPSPKIGNYIEKTKSLFHNFSQNILPKVSLPGRPGKNSILFGAIFLAILIFWGGLFWWFYPKANITIYVTPKSFQEDSNITFNTNGQSDPAAGIIPAKEMTVEVSGNKTKAASGTKLIGDKAKGTVQIANGNSSGIDLAAGTPIISSGGLKFFTNTEASISAQLLPGQPGTANVDVTADSIGAQYNLPKGEVFRVGNFSKSLVAGTSQSDFSGGSSQQISAVSKDDQTALENQLKDELTGNAKDQLGGQIESDQIFVDDLASVDITDETFDHKVGDEADSLKLSLSLKATGLGADKQKLLEYARGVLKDKIPSGFVLRDSQISFKFTLVDKKDNNADYKVTIGANFLPSVDTANIIKQVAGRTPEVTESYLTSIPGFTRADVTLSPRFPGALGIIPRVTKNITVEVVAEK